MDNREFQEMMHQKGRELFRAMPWRSDTRPYFVLVSELMLQQTQVARVMPKFEAFIAEFPDEASLANASLAKVLTLWQGLGYNRRAKFLHEAATMIVQTYGGIFPRNETDLLTLPGVGKNTAGAILAYAFNQPSIFIETNVRTVYIHHFFGDSFEIDDKQIIDLLVQTIDREHPREFYWALMDYGAWLKSNGVRNISASKHYTKQPPLQGSLRETRGAIVRLLSVADYTVGDLRRHVAMDDRFAHALTDLKRDGLVDESTGVLHLTK